MLTFLLPDYPTTIQQTTIAYVKNVPKTKINLNVRTFRYKNHNNFTWASRFSSAQQSSAIIENCGLSLTACAYDILQSKEAQC